jgi:hypothetical protein
MSCFHLCMEALRRSDYPKAGCWWNGVRKCWPSTRPTPASISRTCRKFAAGSGPTCEATARPRKAMVTCHQTLNSSTTRWNGSPRSGLGRVCRLRTGRPQLRPFFCAAGTTFAALFERLGATRVILTCDPRCWRFPSRKVSAASTSATRLAGTEISRCPPFPASDRHVIFMSAHSTQLRIYNTVYYMHKKGKPSNSSI